MRVVCPTRTPGDVRDGVVGAGTSASDDDAEIARAHPGMLAACRHPAVTFRQRPYHPAVIPTPRDKASLRLRRLPDRLAAMRAIDVAESFRDLPGLALLESARPGRNARWTYLTADPIAVLEAPAAGHDPFAVARRLVARLDRTVVVPADAPRFTGGLVGLPRLRPRARRWSASRRSPSTTRVCRCCDSRCTTGWSPGIGGPVMPGSAVARSTATPAGWRAGSMTSTPA